MVKFSTYIMALTFFWGGDSKLVQWRHFQCVLSTVLCTMMKYQRLFIVKMEMICSPIHYLNNGNFKLQLSDFDNALNGG